MNEGAWEHALHAHDWIDNNDSFNPSHAIAMRLMKITEEAGEVTQAYIGKMGQNPRKGVTHVSYNVIEELFDVIISAMVAMYDFSYNPEADFYDLLRARSERLAALIEKGK